MEKHVKTVEGRFQEHTDTRKTVVSRFLEKRAISVDFIIKSLQKHNK